LANHSAVAINIDLCIRCCWNGVANTIQPACWSNFADSLNPVAFAVASCSMLVG
jgi:hypothetical protein